LANSSNAFDENGRLTGEIYVKELTQLMASLRAEIDRK
jgi:chromate reductase, NAD(P)H dehydrogenase (quinone)